MYEAYFGLAQCGRCRQLAWCQPSNVSGAESEQPARGALAWPGSLASEAVRGLFAQAGQADQDHRRDRQCDDDRDDHGRRYP
jgi:hypothetical protein